jgi:hypothetical protein
MDNEFENIVPWNGANDTGKDVRLKWQRNFERIKANFEELLQLIGKVDIQELSKFFLRKDKSDSTDFAVQFNDGVKIGKSWIRWDEINNALYIIGEDGQSKVNFYSFGEVAAGGPGSSSGGGTGGIDENQLWAILANTGTEQISKTHLVDALSGYATENWVLAKNYLTSAALSGYATQSWVTAQGYITSAALEGYATISDVDNRIDDLINGAPAAYDTLKEIADVLQGNVDSIGDIITTLGTKADKEISISAGTGLTGGGNLSASRTLSLATVGTAGTYTKVIVDAYGRVTGHSALAESDIPTLSIAKISGLQTALDNKLDESVFTDLFEKVQVDGNTFIKAKYNLFSIGEVAAGGAGTGSGSSGGIDEAQLWSILGNSGTEQIAKNHLTTALSGYATETWVTGKGYATQSWVTSKGYITSAALEGYATESWVNGKNYLTAITKAMVEAVLTGNITTHTHSQYLTVHQAIYALTIKAGQTTAITFSPKTAAATLTLEAGSGISLTADATAKKITIANTYKYTLPTASASVLGGVKIGANITITNGVISTHAPYSHPTATANTIAAATGKVLSAITVNNLGHVTSVAAKTLAAGDIPTLSISKISGLQTTLDSKLNASVFNDLFEKVTEDGQTFIKAKYNFYSVGEVAAGGTGTGGGSTGGGIDEEQLWAILSNTGTEQIAKNHLTTALTGYATQSWVTSQNYLKTVSLATISDLHANWDALLKVAPSAYITRWPSISEVTSKQNLVVKLNSGTTEGTNMFTYNVTAAKTINITPSAIGAAASSHNHSWANITSGKPTTLAGYGITDGVNAVSVTGSGNAITAASVSGHTLTLTKGSTFLLSSAYTAADVLAKLKTVDGSGSGLDADLLDGLQWSNYNLERLYTINASSLDKTKFYPIFFTGGVYNLLLEIYSPGGVGSAEYNTNRFRAVIHSNGWDDSGEALVMLSRFNYQDTEITIGAIGFGSENGGIAVWVRGGRNYTLRCNRTPSLKTSDYTYGTEIYTVGTNLYGGTNTKVTIKWQNNSDRAKYDVALVSSNVASATKLQTPRTIWGQSFDGTANIAGALTGATDIIASGNIQATSLYAKNGGYFYNDSGWFQNSISSKGLYNKAEDARWYASGAAWCTDKQIRPTATNSKSLGTSTYRWSNVYSVLGNFSGLITASAGLTTPQYIQIGSARIYWDATNNALYVKKSDGTACNFYSLGEITAGGAGTGSGGTGGGIDEEQLWAILGNTGTQQIAKNHLTNALKGYLTTVSLATITDLHSSWDAVLKVAPTSYVTRWPTFSEVTSKPTTLSGYGITDAVTIGTTQTITGTKTFNNLYISNDRYISCGTNALLGYNTSNDIIYVGNVSTKMGIRSEGDLKHYTTATAYTILDTGNYTTTLDTRYVKKSGDIMTGSLAIPIGVSGLCFGTNTTYEGGRLLASSDGRMYLQAGTEGKLSITGRNTVNLVDLSIKADSATINGNEIWHAGNDGSGSGLNADLLDGYQSTSFDLSTNLGNCVDYGYYVIGLLQITDYTTAGNHANGRLSFIRTNGNNTPQQIQYALSTQYNSTNVRFSYIALGNNVVSPCTFTYNSKKWAGFVVKQASSYSNGVICTRFGLRSSEKSTPFLLKYYTSNTETINNSEVYDSLVINGIDIIEDNVRAGQFVGALAGNASSATKLATARTIWGKSFDGTANISGDMAYVGKITFNSDDIYLTDPDGYNILTRQNKNLFLQSNAGGYLSLGYRGTSYIDFYGGVTTASTGGTTLGRWNTTGLGVGTASPSYRLHVAGSFAVTANTKTITIYSENTTWCHYRTTATNGHWFGNNVTIQGNLESYGGTKNLGASDARWNLYAGTGNFTGAVSLSSTFSVSGTTSLSTTNISGTLTAANGIITDYDGSTWISMATRSNLIRSATNNSASSAHALFRVKNSGGDAIVFGGLGTNCGFYGFTAEQISAGTNGTNWSTVWDVATGKLTHNKAMSVSGAVTLSSTLSVASTSTFTGKTTHNGGIACANGLTLSSGELMLGSSSNQKIRKGAASATYWSQLEFFGSAGSNGGFTDIMLNIQSSHTIQFDCGGNFIWFSKGNIAAKGEVAAGSSSDARLKNILSTPDYQKRLLSLGNVVDYEYNDIAFQRKARTTEHRRYTGLIYQNVVNVLPQMAGKDEDGYGYLNYIHTDYINLIAGALQQTILKQETIEQRVARLERENAELKQQLKRLAA